MDAGTLTLLNRSAKPQQFRIPDGWVRKTEGMARQGDRYWHWPDESWQPVGMHAFLGSYVGLLQAVITPAPADQAMGDRR